MFYSLFQKHYLFSKQILFLLFYYLVLCYYFECYFHYLFYLFCVIIYQLLTLNSLHLKMKLLLQGCMSQNDDIMSQASYSFDAEMGEPTVAQLLAFSNGNAVRWPKVSDQILEFLIFH